LKEGLQASIRVVKEERANYRANVAESVSDTSVLTASIDNTSTDKH